MTHDHSLGGKGCKPVAPKNTQRGSSGKRTPPVFRPVACTSKRKAVKDGKNTEKVEREENKDTSEFVLSFVAGVRKRSMAEALNESWKSRLVKTAHFLLRGVADARKGALLIK